MQIEEAIKFLRDAAAKSPTNVLQGIINATSGQFSEAEEAREAIRPVMELLVKSPEVRAYMDTLADGARHQYRCHGLSFEHITFAILLGGFIGGIQFFMNGGIASPSPTASPADLSLPPTRLLN